VHATNPRTRKLRPLRDVKPPRRPTYLKSDINEAFPQYELLIQTVRKTLFGGHLPAWWTYSTDAEGKQRVSHLMNDLIDTGVCQSSHLIRRGLTPREKAFLQSVGDWNDDYDNLVPLPDSEVVKQAKSIAGKLAREQMIIRRPYNTDENGNRILDSNGKPVRGYSSEIKVAHPVQDRDDDGVLQSWTSPLVNHTVSVAGNPISRTSANYAQASTNEMVDHFMTEAFREVLAEFVGDDAQWLLEYYDDLGNGTPKTDVERQRACSLMKAFRGHEDKLQDYLCLLT
jgi:hypothetical protein